MPRLTALPTSLRASSPIAFIATWFGSGLLPKAPGTWGTLAALPVALAIALIWSPASLYIAAVITFAFGTWAADKYAIACRRPDPSEVVIDEVAAIWLVLATVPLTGLDWILAFVAFRFFDIVKPWPVSLADRKLKGGLGIMLDDIIAAIYTMLVLQFLFYLIEVL
jgi:phosphatidylglycerophosphatase A